MRDTYIVMTTSNEISCLLLTDKNSSNCGWRSFSISILLLLLCFLTTGCQLTQDAFSRMAGNAGAAFAAAATTLSYAHQGKITDAYASSSFVNYQSELSGLDQTLPAQQGAPDRRTVEHLLNLYKPAMQAVNVQCLDESCDWHAQVAALERASEALLKAGGS